MGNSFKSANFLMDSLLADAARGDADALYDLGMAYSSGSGGIEVDLIEAHKWFNLAATKSKKPGAVENRDRVAAKMTPAQIAEAQKLAREWKHK